MNWLTPDQKREIRKMAGATSTRETCGFVLENGQVVEVANRADNPVEEFEISPLAYAHWDEVGIKGVWHSHLELDAFSPLDQQVMAADTLPWAVYCLRTDNFIQADPDGMAPLLGRPFCFGVYDCYSLVSDKLSELGVQLPAWPRGPWGEWNTSEFRPFDEQWANVGKAVTDGIYQAGDILLLNLGDHKGHTDHVGVFIDDRRFMHHPAEKLSRLQTFGKHWERYLNLVIRPHQLWTSR